MNIFKQVNYTGENALRDFPAFEAKVGLVQGRHEIAEVEHYVFTSDIEDPTNLYEIGCTIKNSEFYQELISIRGSKLIEIDLYVTGLSVALIEVLNAIHDVAPRAIVRCKHFDRNTGGYYTQTVRW